MPAANKAQHLCQELCSVCWTATRYDVQLYRRVSDQQWQLVALWQEQR